MSTITVTTTANDRDLLASFTKQQAALDKQMRQYDELVRKTKEAEKAAKRAADDAPINRGVAAVSRLAAGWLSIGAAVGAYIAANRQAMAETQQHSRDLDEIMRKFQVQAGLTDLQREDSQKKILDIAIKNATKKEFAGKVATQLVSSGFTAEAATGEALDIALQGFQASNLMNEDPTQLTQAMGQFLEAQGLEKNPKNLERIMVGAQRLFKGTDLQVSDFSQLAGKSQALGKRMSPEEIMGTFDVLRGVTTAEKASTAIKIFGERLTGAKGDKQREDVLTQMGLAPEDVDMIGENVVAVLDRIAVAIDKVKETEREPLLQKLFGTEAGSPIAGLLANRGKIGPAMALLGDRAGFAEDVGIATSGRNAINTRLELQQQVEAARGDRGSEEINRAFDLSLRKNGYSNFDRWRYSTEASLLQGLGFSPAASIQMVAPVAGLGDIPAAASYGTGMSSRVPNQRAVGAAADELRAAGGSAALVEELRKNTESIRENSTRLREQKNPGLGGQKEPGANE